MILTVLANAIVTGIIVYLIQKRIERSYTIQMEEFKSNLQRSAVEHEIRFSKIYPKTLEVLEIYHQKLFYLSKLCFRAYMSIPEAEDNNQPLEPDDIQEKKKEIFEAIADVTNWYRDHRLHLPDSLTKEVGEITDKVVVLGAVSINLLERVICKRK